MQNINLYPPELRPKQQRLSALNSLVLAVAFTLLLLSLAANKAYERSRLEQQLLALNNSAEKLQKDLTLIQNTVAKADISKLDQTITDLRQAINDRASISSIMAEQNVGNDQGYAGQLTALAEVGKPTVALQHFRIYQGNRLANIAGQATSGVEVALFIDHLAKHPNFSATKFGHLSIAETEKPQVFNFSLGFTTVFDNSRAFTELAYE